MSVSFRASVAATIGLVAGMQMLAQAAPEPGQTVVPADAYEQLTLTLVGANPTGGDVLVQIPLRGGKLVTIPFEPALKEGLAHVIPMGSPNSSGRILDTGLDFSGAAVKGLLHAESWGGAYGGRIKGGALSIKATIDLKRDGDKVAGNYEGTIEPGGEKPAPAKPCKGQVTGTWLKDADLAKTNGLAAGKDYPSYYGNGDFAMPGGGTAMVDDLSKAKFIWRSEEWLPVGTGSTSRGPVVPTTGFAGHVGCPILKDGVIYVNYFIPSGDKVHAPYTAWLAENKNADPWLYWMTLHAGQVNADDVIAAIDAATGKTLWRTVFAGRGVNWQGHKGGPNNLTATVGDGKVFFGGSAAVVYAVDAKTGKALWEFEPACTQKLRASPPHLAVCRRALGSPLMYADGVVVSCEYGDRLWNANASFGLDAATGKKLWTLRGFACPNRWTKNGKDYFLMTGDNELACVDPKTGTTLWKVPANGAYVSVSGDYAVVEQSDLKSKATLCYKLDEKGAQQAWSVPFGYDGQRPMSIANGKVFLTPAEKLIVVDLASGKTAEAPADGHNCMGGWFANGRFFYLGDGKHGGASPDWYDVSGDAPKKLWSGPMPQPVTSAYEPQITAMIVDGRLFRRGKDGIYCFDLRAGK